MTFYEKLKINYEKGGLDTVVQDKFGKYRIFSSVGSNGSIRGSSWHDSISLCKNYIGSGLYDRERIDEISKEDNWKRIKTIARESHYEVGDKVKIIKTRKIEKIRYVLGCNDYRLGTPLIVNSTEIEPYFGKEKEEMVTIEISKKSLEGIKNYKIVE